MGEYGPQREYLKSTVDFGKCQMDRVVEAHRRSKPGKTEVEFESFSPYLADYNMATGEMWDDERMTNGDRVGIALAQMLREQFPRARMVSLYDEYNSGMPNTSDARGIPYQDGSQLEFPEETRRHFRNNIENVLRTHGVIKKDDTEGEGYLFVSETEKIKDAESLVQLLEEQGYIERNGEEVYFVNPTTEDPHYQKIKLQSKKGRWLCEALDAASFLKPENREITHLVILPNDFKEQQDKVWEILLALKIARPETYHNIFYDKNLPPEIVVEAIRDKIRKHD